MQIRRQREEEERVKAEEKAKAQAMVRLVLYFCWAKTPHLRGTAALEEKAMVQAMLRLSCLFARRIARGFRSGMALCA